MYHPVAQEEQDDSAVELLDIDHPPASAHNAITSKPTISKRKASTNYLLVFFLINSLAFGITAVPRINLIVSLACKHVLRSANDASADTVVLGGFNEQCQIDSVSSRAAIVMSTGEVIAGVFSAIVSGFLGRLSDRVGRLVALKYVYGMRVLTEGIMVGVVWGDGWLDWRWLYLAFLIDGLGGTVACAMSLSSAYVSDCNPPEKRNVHIGRMHGSMFIGISIGPLLSSLIILRSASTSPLLVFYICSAMRILSILYLSFIPESIHHAPEPLLLGIRNTIVLDHPSHRSNTNSLLDRIKRLSPRAWLDDLIPASPSLPPFFRRNFILLCAINIIVYGAAIAPADVSILYPQKIFHWADLETNYFMATINCVRAFVSTLGLPLLIWALKRLYPHHAHAHAHEVTPAPLDIALLLLALALDTLGTILLALAPSSLLYTLSYMLASFGGIGLSTTEAMLSTHVGGAKYGSLMGGLGAMQGVVRILAPAVAGGVYAVSVGWMPGLVFLGVGGMLGVAWCGVWGVKVGGR